MTAATMNPAGVPMPLLNPTAMGVLNIIAEIGAAPVTVRKSTPNRPTAFLRSFWTSWRLLTSMLSARPPGSVMPMRPSASSLPVPACSLVSDMQPASSVGRARGLVLTDEARRAVGTPGRRTTIRAAAAAAVARWCERDGGPVPGSDGTPTGVVLVGPLKAAGYRSRESVGQARCGDRQGAAT